MLLRQLNISQLHGTINLNINFKEDITLLVGINGCGKTSALNAIDWLLKPDLKRLAINSFEKIELIFDFQQKTYTLKAERANGIMILSIGEPEVTLQPITVELENDFDFDNESSNDAYEGLSFETHEFPMRDLLKSFTKPTVITLDRTITAEAEDILYTEKTRNSNQRRIRYRSPLGHVQEVTSEKFSEYRSKAIQHDNELKARIVMSALQDPELIFKRDSTKITKELDINQLEEKVIKYLSRTIKTEDVTPQVKKFFKSTRILSENSTIAKNDSNGLLGFVFSQYRQVENLAKAFNDFESKNSSSFKDLRDYLDAVNKFFKDSNKTLYFDESTGQLVFSFLNDDQKNREKRAIKYLSSGEKQILILFTFLAFISKSGSVFIVDEPELSLHPKWQYEFMETFLKLRPKNTQLLIATHSPEIVGKFKHACITLKARKNA